MNSNEKAFLEKFCVKQSSNLIGLENVGAAGFTIATVVLPLSLKKEPNLHPSEPPAYQIFTFSP